MSQHPLGSGYVFALAQAKAKRWLCAEVAREHPEARLAYSRPGLYTFKLGTELPVDFRLRSVFARHQGHSLGVASDARDVARLLEAVDVPLVLHVFGRDAGEETPGPSPAAIDACRAQLIEGLGARLVGEPTPARGAWVLDVVVPPEGAREAWFVGFHRHGPGGSPHPGTVARHPLPAAAPSRAFAKVEEMLAWSGLPMAPGETVVEFGCAPGGAALALIQHGLHVVGVDPAEVAPQVAERAHALAVRFEHLRCPIGALRREQLPARVDWLLCDANLAPQVACRYLARWSRVLRPHLRGLVFTMKLNDQRVVEAIPSLVARVAALELGEPRALQLPSHRREIVVVAAQAAAAPRPRRKKATARPGGTIGPLGGDARLVGGAVNNGHRGRGNDR